MKNKKSNPQVSTVKNMPIKCYMLRVMNRNPTKENITK